MYAPFLRLSISRNLKTSYYVRISYAGRPMIPRRKFNLYKWHFSYAARKVPSNARIWSRIYLYLKKSLERTRVIRIRPTTNIRYSKFSYFFRKKRNLCYFSILWKRKKNFFHNLLVWNKLINLKRTKL